MSYNLINKKYNLIVFDSLFNIIGSRDIKIADDEISVTLIEINEVDKYILLQKNYLSNRAGEIFRIRYDGTLIN